MPPYREKKNTHECVFFSLALHGGGSVGRNDCGEKKKSFPVAPRCL
jgi:hypothetical protein